MDAISAVHLNKSYDGKNFALKDLNLTVPQGGVCGFLGPNGAGKTTTVKLMTGLLTATSGACAIMGTAPKDDPVKAHGLCGVMTETARLYGQLTGMENLLFFAQTAGINKEKSASRAQELLKFLGIYEARDKKASAYSTGMMQRLSLARALIHEPKVLFLDEPTSGLDPESSQAVNSLIAHMAKNEGVTVFLCTHQLRYAQDLCDSYGLISHGELLAYGSFEQLVREKNCTVKAGLRLKQEESLTGFTLLNGWWEKNIQSENEMPQLLKQVMESGKDIYEARIVMPTLEDIYFATIGHEQEAEQ